MAPEFVTVISPIGWYGAVGALRARQDSNL
jgi:hypothetical protein